MENNFITIQFENDNSTHTFSEGITLKSVIRASTLKDKDTFLAAYVNNHPKILHQRIYSSCSVRFIPYDTIEGHRIYARTAQMIMEKAIFELTGKTQIRVLHSVGHGIFFEMDDLGLNNKEFAEKVKKRMDELIECNIPIIRNKIDCDSILKLNSEHKDKIALLKTHPAYFYTMYNLDGYQSYYYGVMAPSTGYIKTFDLKPCDNGLVLLLPASSSTYEIEPYPEKNKMYAIFREYKQWTKCLEISCIGDLNNYILNGYAKDVVMVGESLHEKRFSKLADNIFERNHTNHTKVVMIAGPSSSGKTTFAKRLSIHLKIMGLDPLAVSMDDYFVERGKTPKDKNGNYDFECLEAVDIELFNKDIMSLINGETIEIPKYDFITGKRMYNGETMTLKEDSILLIEGIHALNPRLLQDIDKKQVYRIYASALTSLSIDNNNIIHTTDNRLLRRIVRDYNFRGRSAYETLKSWKSVRDGEDENIFPYQEMCDVMANTTLIYELAVLAPKAEPLLRDVPQNRPEYATALRLLNFITYFKEIPSEIVPQTSILREFIGGSLFDY